MLNDEQRSIFQQLKASFFDIFSADGQSFKDEPFKVLNELFGTDNRQEILSQMFTLWLYIDELPIISETLTLLTTADQIYTQAIDIASRSRSYTSIPEELRIEYRSCIKSLYSLVYSKIIVDLAFFRANIRLDQENFRKLPQAINDHKENENERKKVFSALVEDLDEKIKTVEALTYVRPFVSSEESLNAKEAWHLSTIIGCVLAILWISVSLLFYWLGQANSFLYGSGSKFMSTGSVIFDVFIALKLIAPSAFGVLLIAVLLRCISLERHNWLMLGQRRVILRLAVAVIREFPKDEEIRKQVLAALAQSAFSLHPSGYAKKGLEPSTEYLELLRSLQSK